ncbi:hypothetical protein [Paenibacillus urinalis]|uniref:hypothetical protein n=1 Tax=Paenibacillus urinalis TaxID=521520 RepID=UPI002368DEDA|nr:hypothetical protein [Paenibacillus urinalis]
MAIRRINVCTKRGAYYEQQNEGVINIASRVLAADCLFQRIRIRRFRRQKKSSPGGIR